MLRTHLMAFAEAMQHMTLASAMVMARMRGFEGASREDVAKEIAYLEDKGLLALHEKTVSPENRRWRVTAAGRDWLAGEGLA